MIALLCLWLLVGCAVLTNGHHGDAGEGRAKADSLQLPADQSIGQEAGRGGWIFVTLRLENGEKLPVIVDTGCPATTFDKSLEPKLGKRLDTATSWNFGDKGEAGVYVAPRLYLGKTQLQMTGPYLITLDCKKISADTGRHILGIIGMDVLEHYCVQLDFAAGKMRFLDGQKADKRDWGQAFSLTNLDDGCVAVGENLVGAKGTGSMIDTGCDYDGWLTPTLFQQWTNQVRVLAEGETRSPNAVLGGETYPDVDLHGLDAKLLLTEDEHIKLNGIGLHFLSRHRVTFDFPNRTMYLKRTSVDPLVRKDLAAAGKAAAKSAVWCLKRLLKKGQLPGWSKKDEVATHNVHFYYHIPDGITCDHLQKKGDASVYHYEFKRASKDSPWQLIKGWRTDAKGSTLETYPIP